MIYKLRNLKRQEGALKDIAIHTVEAASTVEALQKLFGQPVVDFRIDNDVITALNSNPNGNVVGTAYWFR